jgi:hypothetical protein
MHVVGELSLEGVTFKANEGPSSTRMSLQMRFPGDETPTLVLASVSRIHVLPDGLKIDATFEAPPVRLQLSLARLMQTYARRTKAEQSTQTKVEGAPTDC